ncbi:hypothetical protein NIES208_03100 [[Limnothrix rosea] IAM M-220]|nr:hypothetical protein NIES208_03100 [[Limnothrix rosea] IAM M-220]
MINLKQLQQDIASLSPDAQQVIINLVNLLKDKSETELSQTADKSQTRNVYQEFVDSGLIGCVDVDEDLSTTYKKVLAEGWANKYDHR